MIYKMFQSNSTVAPKSHLQQEPTTLIQISPKSSESREPSTIPTVAINGTYKTAAKNLNADEVMPQQQIRDVVNGNANENAASLHRCPKYLFKAQQTTNDVIPKIRAMPTSVLVRNPSTSAAAATSTVTAATAAAATPEQLEPLAEPEDIKPIIDPITGLIVTNAPSAATLPFKTQAAALAQALLRNNFHSFQQQLRAQEILRQQFPNTNINNDNNQPSTSNAATYDFTPNQILETFLRNQNGTQNLEAENEQKNDGAIDDEDDSHLNGFDDIHLVEKYGNASLPAFNSNNYHGNGPSTSSMMDPQAQSLRNLEFNLSEYATSSHSSSISPNGVGPDGEPVYECRHCGKKYRWKSTLRRHENVECGGKEPSHQCPYCPYKSKQRGNLGVHVRKHHTDLPQLPSKRRSKYSMRAENSNGAVSDDSQSKLVIDSSNWQPTEDTTVSNQQN